jgi:hypothetical protein
MECATRLKNLPRVRPVQQTAWTALAIISASDASSAVLIAPASAIIIRPPDRVRDAARAASLSGRR